MDFGSSLQAFVRKYVLWLCAALTLFCASIPFLRAYLHFQVDYDEGWNVYAADMMARHQPIYGTKYGWITVNYPFVSFWLMARLHSVTHDYLFTARTVSLLSLLTSSLLVGAIVHALGASRRNSVVAGLFCLAVFCANADYYVGMDDPQMLSHAFYLLAFYVYLRSRFSSRRMIGLTASALIYMMAFFTKQNPVDFLLAAVADLALISLPMAVWFCVCCGVFGALGLLITNRVGGPYYLAEFFMKRSYSVVVVFEQIRDYFGPLLIPFLLAVFIAWRLRRDPVRRVAAILFAISFLLGSYFSGGFGVSINSLFSATFAMCILLGLFGPSMLPARWRAAEWQPLAQVVLFVWLLIPLALVDHLNVVGRIRDMHAAEVRYHQDVAVLRQHPGPALCESLLECFEAGKPYLYDPFNATRLIQYGKLDDSPIVRQLQDRQISVVQLDALINGRANPERFDRAISDALLANYTPILDHKGAVIYAPRQ